MGIFRNKSNIFRNESNNDSEFGNIPLVNDEIMGVKNKTNNPLTYAGAGNFDDIEQYGALGAENNAIFRDNPYQPQQNQPQFNNPYQPQQNQPQFNNPYQPQQNQPQFNNPYQPQQNQPQFNNPYQPQQNQPQFNNPYQPQQNQPQFNNPYQPQQNQPQFNNPYQPQQNQPQFNNPYQPQFNNPYQPQQNQPQFNNPYQPQQNQFQFNNPYQQSMFQNGPNIINEETILNSPEIQIQKEYAKIQFGDKFVTKGKLPKELQKEVRCEKIRVSILAVIGILFFSYFLSNIVLWKKHEIIHLLNIELGGVNSSPSVGWLLLSFVGILSFLTLGFASTDYSLLVSNINKCKKDAMNFGKIYVPYFIKRNYKKLSTRDIYINWISFSVYVIGGISVWILCWLNDQSKYDSQTGRLLVSFFWMDIKPPVYYFNRDQQVLINVIFLVGTLILQIYTIVDARMRKQNIISLYQAEIIDQDEINLLRKKANKICLILLIIFLAILFILFFIIYFVSKRTKKIVNKGENGGFLKNVGHFFGRKP